MLGSCFQTSLLITFCGGLSSCFQPDLFLDEGNIFFRSIFDEINDGKEPKSCNSVKTFTYGRSCDGSLMELRFFCSVQKQVFSCQPKK